MMILLIMSNIIIIIIITISEALQAPSCRILDDTPGARKDKNGQDVSKNAKDTDRDKENTFDCRYIYVYIDLYDKYNLYIIYIIYI